MKTMVDLSGVAISFRVDSKLIPADFYFMKKAHITGITGQDGSYLADLLLNKGYELHHLGAQSHARGRRECQILPSLQQRDVRHVASPLTRTLQNHGRRRPGIAARAHGAGSADAGV